MVTHYKSFKRSEQLHWIYVCVFRQTKVCAVCAEMAAKPANQVAVVDNFGNACEVCSMLSHSQVILMITDDFGNAVRITPATSSYFFEV